MRFPLYRPGKRHKEYPAAIAGTAGTSPGKAAVLRKTLVDRSGNEPYNISYNNMSAFTFWVISPDTQHYRNWERIFRKESWDVHLCLTPELFRAKYTGDGLALIEISPEDAANPEKLLKPLMGLPGLITVVFGDLQKTPPSQVARMIEISADDFIPKNIDERVLRSKLKAYLRRAMPSPNCACTAIRSRNGDVRIDKAKRLVRICSGGSKEKEFDCLTPKEFEILYLLLSLEEQIVSREVLLNHIWGEKADTVNSETVDKHVESLRKKLGPFGRQIQTVYGTGYVLKCV